MTVVDTLNRPLRQLRISVIDQCNLRCTYCMPAEVFGKDYAFLPPQQLLTFEEIERIANIFSSLGVEKIRLTGGEPLMRKGLPELIAILLKVKGIQDVSLTTNGLLLGVYAERLKSAGLQRINVSLDSLNPQTYGHMNGRHIEVDKVLRNIEKAATIGLQIKINMVVQKGVNDQDVLEMAKYCFDKGYTLRFIEYMDVGNTNRWDMSQVVSSKDIVAAIEQQYELIPTVPVEQGEVAKNYLYKGTKKKVGFISSVTEAFCSDCNRARISADGKLYTCLFTNVGTDIKTLLNSLTDEGVKEEIRHIWHRRNDRYSEERSEVGKQLNVQKIEMSYIGG
ncbi:MAG: GTP 3',8-cyclase MoaA [Lysinibacillus sp.]